MIWKIEKLGDICEFVRGPFGGSLKKSYFVESGYVVYEQQHAIKNNCENFRYFITQEKFNEMSRFAVSEGDILMSCSGTIGRTTVVPKNAPKGIINQALLKITPSKKIYVHFLKYYMESNLFVNQLMNTVDGAAIQNVASVKTLKDIIINLPPLSEQKRIVTKLDIFFNEINKLISASLKYKDETTSFYENVKSKIFFNQKNFIENNLKEVCEKITDGTHQTPKYFDNGYIFLSSRNVKTKKIDWSKVKYIDEKQHVEMQKRVSPKKGDILLAKNGTTGMGAIVDKDVDFDIYVSLAHLRSKGDIIPEYLLEFINSQSAREQFTKRTKGIGVQNLHLQEIREVKIRYPKSKIEQKYIVTKINLLNENNEKLISIKEKKINNLKALKHSFLKSELQKSL